MITLYNTVTEFLFGRVMLIATIYEHVSLCGVVSSLKPKNGNHLLPSLQTVTGLRVLAKNELSASKQLFQSVG